eukprot:SAG31_NODE_581_length_13927_cov_78.549899_9_plen_76_part_00
MVRRAVRGGPPRRGRAARVAPFIPSIITGLAELTEIGTEIGTAPVLLCFVDSRASFDIVCERSCGPGTLRLNGWT